MSVSVGFRRFTFSLVSFWTSIWILPLAVSAQDLPSEATPQVLSKSARDSMTALGEQQVRASEFGKAVDTFARLVEAYPKDATLQIRLGYAALKKENFEAAKDAFAAARELDPNLPDARVGLGLVHVKTPGKGLAAFYNFRRAVGEGKRAAKIDSTYAPAYWLLGEAYEHFREDHQKAIGYYLKYVELESDDPDGLYAFGLSCVQAKQYDKINTHLTPYLEANPQEFRLLPLVAQGYFFEERFESALEHFERHLQNLDDRERQLYTDISLVASRKELDNYRAIAEATERQAYLEQFWVRRDSDILTPVNERIIEHYRRVWHARTFFAEGTHPWDRRGEVYIRYGEPDYRSRSDLRQLSVSAEVEAVRTRMAVDMYGPEANYLTFTGPVFPVRTRRDALSDDIAVDPRQMAEGTAAGDPTLDDENVEALSGSTDSALDRLMLQNIPTPQEEDELGSLSDDILDLKTRLNFQGYAPLTIDNEVNTVPWETWTYTQIQNGIEFTFTDELGNRAYDFAPLPPIPAGQRQLKYTARMPEYAPKLVFERTVVTTPDYYRPSLRGPALHFYYDLADFRGPDGQTTLEVYYGISPKQLEFVERDTGSMVHVQGTLALADEGHTNIYRTTDTFSYRNTGESNWAKGTFVPDMLRVQVPPGKYELQVQLKDLVAGHIGIYKQSLEVKDYRSMTLQMSDIELASTIGDKGSNIRFRKGNIWVVPMPSRAYKLDQKVYAYFEIYNLNKDAFGQTRYKVQYLVRFSPEGSVGIVGMVASGFRSLLRSKKPQVSVTYEQIGSESSENEYIELDLSKTKPGINVLEVTVTDLVSGETATREVGFHYGRRSKNRRASKEH